MFRVSSASNRKCGFLAPLRPPLSHGYNTLTCIHFEWTPTCCGFLGSWTVTKLYAIGAARNSSHIFLRTLLLICTLHCPFGLQLQNTSSKIKLSRIAEPSTEPFWVWVLCWLRTLCTSMKPIPLTQVCTGWENPHMTAYEDGWANKEAFVTHHGGATIFTNASTEGCLWRTLFLCSNIAKSI